MNDYFLYGREYFKIKIATPTSQVTDNEIIPNANEI